ncbi:MAG: ATP-binding protein [Candidatus Thermoplasmatota archaeon]|nr:ATP-binding protein [Candidatus Thermoplasmatota archaeon]
MPNVHDILIESNPWWKGPVQLEYKERELHRHLKKYLPRPQIIALTGLRRVGKTTLLLKILQDSIAQGQDPRNLLYFSFDEFETIDIRDLIKEYERFMKKDLTSGKYLFFFDEVQKLNHWETQIKRLYDAHKTTVKLFISGSESLFIHKKSKETLAGRLFEFILGPLSFPEYLVFKNIRYDNIDLHTKELEILFAEYMRTQGFPELIDTTDKEIIKKYIKESILEKIIYRDIPSLVRVRNPAILASLLSILTEEPGQLVDLVTLANELHISRQTLAQYLRYLEEAFLIRKLYNYSHNRRKIERKLKKYYPTVLSVDLTFKDDPFSQSKVLEWLAVNQLQAEYFWRDSYKNEVDIIDVKNTKTVPYEVKQGKIETKGLLKFMDLYHLDEGSIITSVMEEKYQFEKKIIRVIPLYKLLLTKSK